MKAKLHCIDTFNGTANQQDHRDIFAAHGDDREWLFRTFQDNLKRYELDEQVIIHRMSSTEAVKSWNAPIAFLYIDGDHEYEAVLQDFENWSKFLLPGALISFDDVPGWPGPTRVAGIVISKQEFQKYGVAPNVLTFKKIS
ncbi:glycosyl transferase family 2 [Galdieria sulphuraria]|uniref:Glycosyl transferase family 2 n=1 Tax=Galdieria sulphuraria TaxID=130081 RepID=M2W5W6_GALSU|nr:glycosyl transferase family 2 [Galdieria sulphuraria]EME31166.1 glycosyl transferase family 2 [Galdieria sulphuraria]|eukprot:XP_005707686.1 glycosyl transferase family 2 [Galdieria sulphuraria]